MPRQTLYAIQKRIAALTSEAKRLERQRKPALRQILTLLKKHDISLSEIRGALGEARKGKRRIRKVAAMYKNPKTGETWSGRGRPARWLAAAEKAGRKRAEFLIKKT